MEKFLQKITYFFFNTSVPLLFIGSIVFITLYLYIDNGILSIIYCMLGISCVIALYGRMIYEAVCDELGRRFNKGFEISVNNKD